MDDLVAVTIRFPPGTYARLRERAGDLRGTPLRGHMSKIVVRATEEWLDRADRRESGTHGARGGAAPTAAAI